MCPYKYILCIHPDEAIREVFSKFFTGQFKYEVVVVASIEEAQPYAKETRLLIAPYLKIEAISLLPSIGYHIPVFTIMTPELRNEIFPPDRFVDQVFGLEYFFYVPFDPEDEIKIIKFILKMGTWKFDGYFEECADDKTME